MQHRMLQLPELSAFWMWKGWWGGVRPEVGSSHPLTSPDSPLRTWWHIQAAQVIFKQNLIAIIIQSYKRGFPQVSRTHTRALNAPIHLSKVDTSSMQGTVL